MSQLTSTAASAWRVVDWLRAGQTSLATPLKTCRVLLSPAPGDAALPVTEPVTVDQLITECEGWRADACDDPASTTFFYFAGHGVQRTKDDAILCLQNFLRPGPMMRETVPVENIFLGMSPTPAHNIARRQFYFIDACRQRPDAFAQFDPLQAGAVFDTEPDGVDDRVAPIFFGANSNSVAMAFNGRTCFSEAFLRAVQGGAGDSLGEDANGQPIWGVSVWTLSRKMPLLITDINIEHGANQQFNVGGQLGGQQAETPLCHFAAAPVADLSVEINPAAACQIGRLVVSDGGPAPQIVQPPVVPSPFIGRVPIGLYDVQVQFNGQGGFADARALKVAQTPRSTWKVAVR
jgi:hypothetical protein